MALTRLYKFVKPLVSRNKFLKALVIGYGQTFRLLPKVLTVALTYRCPCHCVHCGISDYRRQGDEELSTQEVKTLIDDSRRVRSIVQVTFTGGEPMVCADIYDLVAYSKSKGFFTKIDSNAVFLDAEKLKRLKAAGIDRVGISLDHYQADAHDHLRDYKGLFDRIIAAVRICEELGISCYLQTYATRQRMEEGGLEKILELAKGLRVDKTKVQTPALIGTMRHRDDAALKHEDFEALARILAPYPSAYVESEVFSPLDYRKFCRLNFISNVHITAYGDVLPCCWMPLSFGNVRERRLPAILRDMYRDKMFKKLLSSEGCLCSDKEFLKTHIGDSADLPVRVR